MQRQHARRRRSRRRRSAQGLRHDGSVSDSRDQPQAFLNLLTNTTQPSIVRLNLASTRAQLRHVVRLGALARLPTSTGVQMSRIHDHQRLQAFVSRFNLRSHLRSRSLLCPNLVCERHAPRCKSSRALSQAQPLSGPKKFRTLRFSRARLASYGACFARVRHENFSRTYRSPPRALRTVASRVRASAPTANPQTSRFSETSSRSSRVAAARSRRDSRRTRVAHVSCSRSTITSSVEARGDAREALQSAA